MTSDEHGSLAGRLARVEALSAENNAQLREMRVEWQHTCKAVEQLCRNTERLHVLLEEHTEAEELQMAAVEKQLVDMQTIRRVAVYLVGMAVAVGGLAMSAYKMFKA